MAFEIIKLTYLLTYLLTEHVQNCELPVQLSWVTWRPCERALWIRCLR